MIEILPVFKRYKIDKIDKNKTYDEVKIILGKELINFERELNVGKEFMEKLIIIYYMIKIKYIYI